MGDILWQILNFAGLIAIISLIAFVIKKRKISKKK
ncbi:LPXTG cell wall anchor domain-containing protein [Neobacillus sp. M.A.Huq-85]